MITSPARRDRRLAPGWDPEENARPAIVIQATFQTELRSSLHAENHAVLVVRQQRRGGYEVLYLGLQEFQDWKGHSLPRGIAGSGGNRDGRQLPDRGAGIHRPERGSGLQIYRGHIIRRQLRDPGRGGSLLDEAHGGRREGSGMRLAKR